MTIDFLQKDPQTVAADLLVLTHFQGTKLSGTVAVVDKQIDGVLTRLVEEDAFEGSLGQVLLFPALGRLKCKKIALIGLGDKKKFDADTARRIGGHLVKLAERAHATTIAATLPGAGILDAAELGSALVEGVLLADYRFHAFHGTKRRADTQPQRLTRIIFCETDIRTIKRAQDSAKRGRILAEATCYARDLVNTPSSHMTPAHLAEEAKKLVGKGISVKLLDKKEMERQKMHAALAVARGSMHDPVGVHLTYAPRSAKKKVVVVGKAVTFDSGGLNIKPSAGMVTMKMDMAGAASVLGLFAALRDIRPDVEVHGIFLAVENMPSGTAYRPGDVVTAKNGVTIEILDTDAEGRVTLADALSYATELEPDVIIDLATLTGACIVALGEELAALFSNDERLGQKLLDAAHVSGEGLWALPLYEPYNDAIKSKIADINNTGGRDAGATKAALFLQHFVGDALWAHLDIAGPAYTEKEIRPDQPYGARGYGVRLLMAYLERLR